MSETVEKRYSAKQIIKNLSSASIAWRLVEGQEHEEAIDEFCTLFLVGFLGEETYKQVMAELMVGARRDSDVAGDV